MKKEEEEEEEEILNSANHSSRCLSEMKMHFLSLSTLLHRTNNSKRKKKKLAHLPTSLTNPSQPSLHAITSQHALTTQQITILPSGDRAHATTYFSGVHFGQNEWSGQTCTAYGKYVDELILLPSKDEDDGEAVLAGASGHWRVSKRRVEFMARIGEEGIFKR